MLVVALLVAAVTAPVLALTAGARRTASAPAAYTAALGGDVDAALQQASGPPRTAEIGGLPGVASVRAMTFAFGGFLVGGRPEDGTLAFIGSRPFSSRLVAGRETDPTKPQEFVADRGFVARHHARLGDSFSFVGWSRRQGATGQGYNGPPQGPQFEARLVGVMDTASRLEDDYDLTLFSRALLDADIGLVATLMEVRLDHGVTRAQLRSTIDELPGGAEIQVEAGQVISAEIRNGVDAQARGIWLMAIVGAIATIVALGQLLTRHARLALGDRRPLSALGYTQRELASETVVRAALPATAGVAFGAVIAVLASGLFPTGFVRALEPRRGMQLDAAAVLVGGSLLLVACVGWVAIATALGGRTHARHTRPRAGDAIARGAPTAAAATGTNFALTGREGSSVAAFGTLASLAFVVAGLVAAAVFGTSLDRVVSEHARFGSNFTFQVGDNTDLTAADLRERLAGDDDIASMMILTGGTARRGERTVGVVGVEYVKHGLAPHVLSGRLPEAPDEIALGRVEARGLDVGIGDTLDLAGSDGRVRMTVVGTAVVPTVAGNDGVGNGGIVTSAGLSRLQSEPDAALAAIELAPDASVGAARRDIARRTGYTPGLEDRPAAIINLGRVRHIPAILAGLLAALALLTTVHALITSIQQRRRDMAVLRALGAGPRWVRRTVHWQATVLTALPLVVAVPLGVVLGSVVFRAFIDRVGALPDPSFSVVVLAGIALGLVAVANLVAVIPARRARRASAAVLLQSD
jgi:ABC-type lipoprotein release transport system permease subunit